MGQWIDDAYIFLRSLRFLLFQTESLSCPAQTSLEQKQTKATKSQSRNQSGGETRQGIMRLVSTTHGGERPRGRLRKAAESWPLAVPLRAP
jgi:hypothetical protein